MNTIHWKMNDSVNTSVKVYRSEDYPNDISEMMVVAELPAGSSSWDDPNGNDAWYVVSSLMGELEVKSPPVYGKYHVGEFSDVLSRGNEVANYPLLIDVSDPSGEDSIDFYQGKLIEKEGFDIPFLPSGPHPLNKMDVSLSEEVSSMSLWFRSYGLNGVGYQKICDLRYLGGSGWFGINGTTGSPRSSGISNIYIDGEEGNESMAFDGKWHHVYFEFSSTDGITFGNRYTSTNYGANGVFRAIRLFKRTLFQDDIQLLYKEGMDLL